MKPWIAVAAALYPRSWCEEFGEEFGALFDDMKPGWRVFRAYFGRGYQDADGYGNRLGELAAAMAAFGAA